MGVRDWTKFKGVYRAGDNLLMSELENNMKSYLDWSFLGIGAYTNISIPTTGIYSNPISKLRLVDDPSFSSGKVWETPRKDIVWESGVEWSGTQPINITGIKINGTYYAANHSTYGYIINYPLGRIIFNNAISTNSIVEMSYSYRKVQVYKIDDAPWWREIQYRSIRSDNVQYTQSKSGEWSIGSQHRVQLPTILLECVPRGVSKPYELGNGALSVDQDILFHIVADNRSDRNDLVDIIRLQNDKTIWLYNSNTIASNSAFPLNYNGSLVNNPKMYPTLVDTAENGGFRWKRCILKDMRVAEVESPSPYLYEGVVRGTCEVVYGDI